MQRNPLNTRFNLLPEADAFGPALLRRKLASYVQLSFLVSQLFLPGTVAFAEPCHASAAGSSDYRVTVKVIKQLPEFRAWRKLHSFPAAFGEAVDRQHEKNGQCFWSVSVFASRPERLELWQVFLVHRSSKTVWVQPANGDPPLSIEAWRRANHKKAESS